MSAAGFHHEAFLYSGTDAFVVGALTFLEPAVAGGHPALVMTDRHKGETLRAALGGRAPAIEFDDMGVVGHNPARIIPAWLAFAAAHRDAPVLWGIGEPAWPGRSAAELVECRYHETLLNLAFADAPFQLLCPYDTSGLGADTVDGAYASHPEVSPAATGRVDPARPGGFAPDAAALMAEALPEPPASAAMVPEPLHDLRAVRRHVARVGDAAGLCAPRVDDFVLAVDEVVSNSVRHAGGARAILTWTDATALVCEVRDDGQVTDAMVGRLPPATDQVGGRGLWIANQLCDLVQMRSSAAGTVVRLHQRQVPAPV